ncbi:hypothetical protein KEM60_01801 [Austwickia sp. TVS 96-490-7B]|nr:hypothetical protein [Austwickia sp. TVS 96-490-7B]
MRPLSASVPPLDAPSASMYASRGPAHCASGCDRVDGHSGWDRQSGSSGVVAPRPCPGRGWGVGQGPHVLGDLPGDREFHVGLMRGEHCCEVSELVVGGVLDARAEAFARRARGRSCCHGVPGCPAARGDAFQFPTAGHFAALICLSRRRCDVLFTRIMERRFLPSIRSDPITITYAPHRLTRDIETHPHTARSLRFA